MAVISCPGCQLPNNLLRRSCRKCGCDLRGLKYPTQDGRGRLTFPADELRYVSRPSLTDVAEGAFLPVLSNGKATGFTVAVLLYDEKVIQRPTKFQLDQMRDVVSIVSSALGPIRRPRKV